MTGERHRMRDLEIASGNVLATFGVHSNGKVGPT